MNVKTKHFIVVALLWLFAPAAWIIMWKDHKYHSWFPTLLWTNGIVFGFIFLTQGFVLLPKLQTLYEKYNVQPLPFFTPAVAIVLIGFALFQIVIGFYMKNKVKKYGCIYDHYISIIMGIFTIDLIIGFLTGILRLSFPIK